VSYLEKSPTELFASLDGEPDAPSRVDIAAAMVTGRRRKRGRVAAACAAVAALVGGTAVGGALAFGGASPEPLPHCVAVPLPMGSFTSIEVTGGDPTGRYIAGLGDPLPGQKSSVVVWHDGEIVDVLRRPGVRLSDFTAGGVGVGGDDTRAYVYRDGTLTALKGERAAAVAVDGAGVVVGRVGQRPARWASPAGDPVLLPLPPGATTGSAVAVAADGTIAGHVSDKDGLVLTAYLWRPDGSHGPVDLPVVDGKRALWFEPQSVRGGWVYGALVVQGDRVTARTGPSGEPVPIEPAIHAFRQIPFRIEVTTGRSQALPQPADRSLGALYVGDRVVTLPPDPTAAEGSDYHVSAVGDDGRTAAGESSASSGPPIRPVAWRCD
jgi:hypothetical protein